MVCFNARGNYIRKIAKKKKKKKKREKKKKKNTESAGSHQLSVTSESAPGTKEMLFTKQLGARD